MDIEKNVKDIQELKSEIMKLEVSIEDLNVCNQMGTEAVALVQEKIKDNYMQLRSETTNLLENADSEKLNNPDFLESINVDKINDVYVQKIYSCGRWTAVVDNNDILKMEEKNGLNALEFKFKDCDIKNALFDEKFENYKFENCSLFSCEFTTAKFENTTFKNVTFYDCVLQNVKFENCKFEKCYNCIVNSPTEKSENIEFVNTDIKDSRLDLGNAGTSLDLKSISLKNCSLENIDCYLIADEKYKNQSITKKINSEQTFMKLLDRNLKKSLKKGAKSQEHLIKIKDKKARTRRKGKSR